MEKIDEAIKDIILDLNNLGYKTFESCAGYSYPGHLARGRVIPKIGKLKYQRHKPYIAFKSSLKQTQLLAEKVFKFGWFIHIIPPNRYCLSLLDGLDNYAKTLYDKNRGRAASWNLLRDAIKELKIKKKNRK